MEGEESKHQVFGNELSFSVLGGYSGLKDMNGEKPESGLIWLMKDLPRPVTLAALDISY